MGSLESPLVSGVYNIVTFLSDSAACRVSHCQNDSKLRLAAQHARVSLASSFERIGLDPCSHALQLRKVERDLGIGGGSRKPALNRPAAGDELYRRDFDGVECGANDDQLAVRGQSVDQSGHRLGARGG